MALLKNKKKMQERKRVLTAEGWLRRTRIQMPQTPPSKPKKTVKKTGRPRGRPKKAVTP